MASVNFKTTIVFFQFIYLKIYKKYANTASFRTIISEIFMKNADIKRENRRIVSYFAFIKIVNIFADYQNYRFFEPFMHYYSFYAPSVTVIKILYI